MALAQTERLTLRRLSKQDVVPFQACRSDAEVAKFQGWDAMNEAEALGFLAHMESVDLLSAGKWTQLAIALRDTDTLVGDIGVHISDDENEAELGISLSRDVQGKSIGFEAVEMVCAWLFTQTKIRRIIAITHAQNKSALALLARTPFQHTHDTNGVIDGVETPERWFERRRS